MFPTQIATDHGFSEAASLMVPNVYPGPRAVSREVTPAELAPTNYFIRAYTANS
jgi:hypothetical protein